MTINEATEQAYKNGYEKGKQDAVKQCNNIMPPRFSFCEYKPLPQLRCKDGW